MDPIDVREESVTTANGAVPVAESVPAAGGAPVERGFPVRGTSTAVPTAPAPVATRPVAAAPVTTAPVVAAPAAATAKASRSRTTVYPVGYRTIQLVWLLAVVADIILALDFAFKAANAHNTGFAHYIFRLAGWLAAPFNGIFNPSTAANGSVLRWADVLAVVIYTVAAWIITRLVRIVATPRAGVPT